jgi:mannitol/fructose-specific phosphotransferase system IIA component (Ntr-type)
MSTVADYTEPSLMVPLLRSRDAAGVTAELCSTLDRQGRISDLLPFYHAVISHEALSSTAMAPGWAMPHARLAVVRRLSFALGRTAEPLVWFGGEPVNMVFLFAVPESQAAACAWSALPTRPIARRCSRCCGKSPCPNATLPSSLPELS